MSCIQSTLPSRTSQRITDRKAKSAGAKGPKASKGKSLPTASTSKNSKPSISKGRGRGRGLTASTEVAKPGSSAMLTMAQVHQGPHSVVHPTAADSAQHMGYNDPQFEDSESDEGDQVVAFTPPLFTGNVPQLHGFKNTNL